MKQRVFGSSLPLIGYAFFVAVLFLFVKGYQFNTDDQAEHLPQIYQQLDLQLYPNDYFVNQSNAIFTVRHYYEKLVLLVAETIGLEWGLFVLTFFCIALMAFSFARIAEELFQDRWTVLLAPILAMFVFYNFTVGGNHIMYGSFISSTIAKGISAFALLQFIRSKHLFASIVLGIATLFQPLVGLQLFLLLGAILLLFRRNLRETIVFGLGFIAVASFILVPTFARQFAESAAYDKDLYYEILYRFRNHHHYLPSLFPVTHYVKFLFLTLIGVEVYAFTKPSDKGFFVPFVTLGLLGMLVYAVGLEFLHIQALGKLQWFKVTVWIGALSSIMLAGLIGPILSGFFPLTKTRQYLFPFSFFLFLLFTFSITNSKFLPATYQHKYLIGNRNYTDLEKMHFWIEENTEKDVSVLVSPDDNAFPCQAKRSIPIHFQAIIHEPFFMLPWYDDFKEIYGVSVENQIGIDARAQAVSLFQTRNYRGSTKHIDYRLDNLERCQFKSELGSIKHQEGKWILTEFISSSAK
ncbi:MAG: hypothetical protein KBF73_04645 [Flavobacteriales bacterium]|nr:hypothetical protein [Flavobacteriales bacterium]